MSDLSLSSIKTHVRVSPQSHEDDKFEGRFLYTKDN